MVTDTKLSSKDIIGQRVSKQVREQEREKGESSCKKEGA
jgi:hypothetical protein